MWKSKKKSRTGRLIGIGYSIYSYPTQRKYPPGRLVEEAGRVYINGS